MATANAAGRKPPTMQDVARAAGVSKALVSMIFRDAPGPNAQTRLRVLAAADRIGYRRNRTASSLARRRSKHLGVVLTAGNSFHADLVQDVQSEADAVGYEIVLSMVSRAHDEHRAVDTLLEYRCEALILLGPQLSTARLRGLAEQVPVVAVGRRSPGSRIDVVRTADGDGLRQVVDHLAALGHEHIVHVDGGSGSISAERRRGYVRAMRRRDLVPRTIAGDLTEVGGAAATEMLLEQDPMPTAVTAFNDECAVGVLDRLRRMGLAVPAEISVVGFDDSPISRLSLVDLTTVSQEPEQQARVAVRAAVDRLEGRRSEPAETVLSPRLVIRGSTAPLARAERSRAVSRANDRSVRNGEG